MLLNQNKLIDGDDDAFDEASSDFSNTIDDITSFKDLIKKIVVLVLK